MNLPMNNPMSPQTSTAILFVSFGTAVTETREKALDAIGSAVQNSYPSCKHVHAWTSAMLRKKASAQSGRTIPSVTEALTQFKTDGISKVIVQPTFISDGAEYQKLKAEIQPFHSLFASLALGLPLLHDNCDLDTIIAAVMQEFPSLSDNELLLFMGHGATDDESSRCDSLYARLNLAFHQKGYKQTYLYTMNSNSAIREIISIGHAQNISTVILAPFMITAGHHAQIDMAGDHEHSWKSQLEQAGFSVKCRMKGLGEFPEIQKLFADRIRMYLD